MGRADAVAVQRGDREGPVVDERESQVIMTVLHRADSVRAGVDRRSLHRQRLVPLAFIAPNLIGVVVFTLVPLLAGIFIAFTKWNVVSGIRGIQWIGTANFTGLFGDPAFGRALLRTAFYAGVSVPVTVVLGLALAIVLNKPIPGRSALRVIFFLPYVVNIIAIGTVWLIMLNPQSGIVNELLRDLGLSSVPGWLISSQWALPALMIMAVWGGVGYDALIYLAALQDMPQDLYEAGMVDGATAWQRFRTITWPALTPTTLFLGITTLISSSQGFGMIAFLTQGGPGTATTTVSYYMYENGFQYYRFGYAAAMGMVMFVAVLVLTLMMWRFQRGRGLYT